MNAQFLLRRITVIISVLALFGAASCSKPRTPAGKASNIDFWTCTMHPSVHSKDPGKCPICLMDLVPVLKKSGGETKPAPSPQMQETKSGEMQGMSGMQG